VHHFKATYLSTLFVLFLSPITLQAQDIVRVGQGSYASYTPLIKSKSTTHTPDAYGNTGDQSQFMQYRKLYVKEREGQPIPTNDWWTNLITEQYSGHLWSYPQFIQAQRNGLDIQHPTFWIDNGTEMKSNTILNISGTDFKPESATATQWHDWDVEFSMIDGDKSMDITMAHGTPFTWIELQNLSPRITLTNSNWTSAQHNKEADTEILNAHGAPITGSTTTSSFIMKKDRDAYGVFLPEGTSLSIDNKAVKLHFSGTQQYIVVACLNSIDEMETLSPFAYSIPRNTHVDWRYDATAGKVHTQWTIEAESLNGGQVNVLQGFLPHQYRDTGNPTTLPFNRITYNTPRGKLRMATGNQFNIDYNFYGMLPYYAMPNNTDGDHPFSMDKMLKMLKNYADNGTFGSDTYWGGKGLTQMALYMMFAREMGDTALFVQCRDRLKENLIDWYTFTPGENDRFFARFERWGGLVGYNTSYDSETFNDHHFHYGYFSLASALLALVDKDFRDNYGEMARLVVKDYANWERQDTRFPFFRTFDPWAGHSFAGGMGDGNGNGQESSSEAMQGWGGMYLLGVALGDREMRDAGLFGWVSEARGVAEYWFDRHDDPSADYSVANYHQQTTEGYNIPYSLFSSTYSRDGVEHTMTPPYNSNLTCHGVGWWTYFGWDAIFMQGIQWMPISPALDYLSENKKFAAWDYQRLMQDKIIGGWHADSKTSAGYLGDSGGWGNVALSYLQQSNPEEAAKIFDECWEQGDKEFTQFNTNGITYFITHSHLSHGDLDWTVTADYPTARAFNKNGTRTYQIFNPEDRDLTVRFSDGYSHTVAPHELFISDFPTRKAVGNVPPTAVEHNVLDAIGMANLALHKPCTASGYENVGTLIEYATDGDDNTRWGSRHQDGEWIVVDLQEAVKLHKLRLHWEAAYASNYTVLLSDDGNNWTEAQTVIGDGGWDELMMNDAETRYFKILGNERGTPYGISLYEIEAYGQPLSMTDNDILGIKIIADRDVLKQHQPSQLTAMGYTVGGQWTNVNVDWQTEDGTITKDGVFTPSTFGMVKIKATTDNISITQTFAVEEAMVMSSFKAYPALTDIAIGGDGAGYTFVATNQFGAPMNTAELEYTANLYAVASDNCLTPTSNVSYNPDERIFTAGQSGNYAIVFDTGLLKDTVYIRAKAFTDFNLALHKTVVATSENGNSVAAKITDGDAGTRWESVWANTTDELTIDLYDTYRIDKVKILWENASAKKYRIWVSTDGKDYTTVAESSATTGGWKTTYLTNGDDGQLPQARFVRIQCLEKQMPAYGYSIFEVEVYGTEKIQSNPSTAIHTLSEAHAFEQGNSCPIYDLTGRKISSTTYRKGKLPKGVYIVAGKKLLIK
jgi:endoglucanase Acf2